ncbi:MAG: polysulfide reductase NrfD [Ignavibacteriales bacterium]|nr:polysulfide reductase NrfD [Ignavibacteriales bacterium]MCF8435454.1 polysulfide reductase NrfD [Ignavibacteriales bacterium]
MLNEITTSRSNHLIDPIFHVWGWEIPVYLFIGGIVAGMMIISGYSIMKGRITEPDCSCRILPRISFILLSIGMFALFLDLEYKIHFWRLYTTFEIKSPMSWGAWILLLVYPVLIANILMAPPEYLNKYIKNPGNLSKKFRENRFILNATSYGNIVLGLGLGVYTGVLLSSMVSRPLWNSSLLAVLFLISGLSAAAAFVHMIARNVVERETLARADNIFLSIELVVIFLFIAGLLNSTEVQIKAAYLLLTGTYAVTFWVFVVGLGIIIPLLIQTRAVNHKVQHTAIAPVLVIMGGLILRFLIVEAGQYSHWLNAHF